MRKSALIMAASALLLGAVSCSEKKADEPVKRRSASSFTASEA